MPTKYLSESLLQSRPFRYLSKEQVAYVQSFGRILEFRDNKDILTQGKVGNGLYIVLQGRANVAIRVLGEKTLTVAHFEEGDFFGEPNLLNTQQSTASVSAQKKTVCFLVPRICFDSFSISAPEIRYLISKALVEDVIQRYRKINDDVSKILSKNNMTKISLKKSSIKRSPADLRDIVKIPMFQYFEESELEDMVKNSYRLYIEDCSLIDAKETSGSCFFIFNGAVMANIASGNSRTHFAVHQAKTFVCPISVLDKNTDIFTYNTCGPASLLEIPSAYLNSVSKNNLALWSKFFALFAKYIFDLQKNLNTTLARFTHENFF